MPFNWNRDELQSLLRECRDFVGDHYVGFHDSLLHLHLERHDAYKSSRKRVEEWKQVEHEARLLERRFNDLRNLRGSAPY